MLYLSIFLLSDVISYIFNGLPHIFRSVSVSLPYTVTKYNK
jgi:hypothetical protein